MSLLTFAPGQPCDAWPVAMSSEAMRIASWIGIAKPRPIDPCGVGGEVFGTPQGGPSGGDADELTLLVNQRATRIARIDRSIGLDRLVCHQSAIGTRNASDLAVLAAA